MMQNGGLDVIVEATGNPVVGFTHAKSAIQNGLHAVMVNVEANVLASAQLAREAKAAGVEYSMAYGDQPALTCELADRARSTGFDVVAAGKSTKYLPSYHASTPETVWHHYVLTADQAAAAVMNSQMFNSFLDGTKSAVKMAAIANATSLAAPEDWLKFPPPGWMIWRMCCAHGVRAGSWPVKVRSRWFRPQSSTAGLFSPIWHEQ